MICAVPEPARGWQHALDGLREPSLAHAPEWFAAIQSGYGHEPLYLTAEDDEGRVGLLPAFIVRRPFLGTVVSSMPFLDTGGPCSSSDVLAHLLVDRLVREARRVGADAVELRCTERLWLSSAPRDNKVGMTLSLPADADSLWRSLDKAVRNQVRKAERAGLSVEFGGLENLPCFYDIFAARMRDLGSPVHASRFLGAVVESFGDRARIALVRKGTTPIGGLVALAFKDRLFVPWATCLTEYFALCPNMLMYWETLRRACGEGVRSFDFGRSSRDSGTYRFKRQWGAEERPLFWYTIPVGARGTTDTPTEGKTAALASRVWQRLPVSVTRRLGPPIRKYLTQ
jgi:serine/alanine adding enzyme